MAGNDAGTATASMTRLQPYSSLQECVAGSGLVIDRA